MNYALLSRSRYAGDALLRRIATAADIELPNVVLAWAAVDASIAYTGSRVIGDLSELRDTDTPMLFTETIDDIDALAYHFVKPDAHGLERPYGIILADGTAPGSALEQTTLHELCETPPDPLCDKWDTAPDGRKWSREICDWVEEDPGMMIDIGAGDPVLGTNWIYPRALGLAQEGPYDRLGRLKAAFTLSDVPGAYASTLRPGDGTPEQLPPGYRAPPRKLHQFSRMVRRNVKVRAAFGPITIRTGTIPPSR